jgi:hypothetical protein
MPLRSLPHPSHTHLCAPAFAPFHLNAQTPSVIGIDIVERRINYIEASRRLRARALPRGRPAKCLLAG